MQEIFGVFTHYLEELAMIKEHGRQDILKAKGDSFKIKDDDCLDDKEKIKSLLRVMKSARSRRDNIEKKSEDKDPEEQKEKEEGEAEDKNWETDEE